MQTKIRILEQSKPETSLETKTTKLKWCYFSQAHHEKAEFFCKRIMLGKKEVNRNRRQNVSRIDSKKNKNINKNNHSHESIGADQGF